MATAALQFAPYTDAPRVYSYTRFSTPEQAEGDSFRRQTEGARKWMVRKNAERTSQGLSQLTFDERLSLSDLGVSAYRGSNAGEDKGLGGFLRACREGLIPEGSYLIVESLDRISRMTPRRVSRLLDDIVDAGVVIATLSDGQEYDATRLDSDPTALLIALMVSWRAHEESKMKGQRLSEAWAEKRRRVRAGIDPKLTTKAPAWLQWTEDGWKERTPHSDTVRRIYQMALNGMGDMRIAQALNGDGTPVMGRGRMWHRSTVAKILGNPAVVGVLTPGKMDHTGGKARRALQQPIPDAYPAVIRQEQWATVRAIKDGRTPAARGRGAVAPLTNIFAGLARCPECGAAMTRVFKGSGSKAGKPKLVCTRAKTGAAEHGYRSVALPPLQDALLSKWHHLMFEVPAGDRGGKLDENRRDLVAVINATEWQLEDLSARMQREPSQTLATRLRAVDAALRSYRSDLEVLEQQATLMDQGLATARLEALAEALEDEAPNIGRINSALRSVFHAVTIDYGTGHLRFKWRQGGETAITYAWVD